MGGFNYKNDRNLNTGYLRHTDKPIGLHGASWVEPTGAVVLFDDFLQDTLEADHWDAVSLQATGGTDFAISTTAGDPVAGHGGWVAGTTGTGDNDAEALFGQLAWKAGRAGNGMLVYEAAISLPSVAGVGFSVGLTDARTESAALFALSGTTWTTTPTDAVAWAFDTDATTDVANGIGVKADVDTAAVAGVIPVATTFERYRIEIDSTGRAYFFQGSGVGVQPSLVGTVADAVTTTVLLAPYIEVSCKAGGAAKSLECDYILTACAR